MIRWLKSTIQEQRDEWRAIRALYRAHRELNAGRYEDAMVSAFVGREYKPFQSWASMILGYCSYHFERFEEAKEHIEEYLKEFPDDPKLNRQMTLAIHRSGGFPEDYRPYLERYWQNREKLHGQPHWTELLLPKHKRIARALKREETDRYNEQWDEWAGEMMEYYRKLDEQ